MTFIWLWGTFIWEGGSFIRQGGTVIWQEETFILRRFTILFQINGRTKFGSCVRALINQLADQLVGFLSVLHCLGFEPLAYKVAVYCLNHRRRPRTCFVFLAKLDPVVGITRPILSQPRSLSTRRTTFPIHIQFADHLILRFWNCERPVGWLSLAMEGIM